MILDRHTAPEFECPMWIESKHSSEDLQSLPAELTGPTSKKARVVRKPAGMPRPTVQDRLIVAGWVRSTVRVRS